MFIFFNPGLDLDVLCDHPPYPGLVGFLLAVSGTPVQGVQFIVLYNVQGVQFIVLYNVQGVYCILYFIVQYTGCTVCCIVQVTLSNVQGVQFMALYKGSTFNRFVLCTGCTAGVQLKILC